MNKIKSTLSTSSAKGLSLNFEQGQKKMSFASCSENIILKVDIFNKTYM